MNQYVTPVMRRVTAPHNPKMIFPFRTCRALASGVGFPQERPVMRVGNAAGIENARINHPSAMPLMVIENEVSPLAASYIGHRSKKQTAATPSREKPMT